MSPWPILLLLAAAPPVVEVTTLNGEQQVGGLERLSDESAVLKSAAGTMTIPAADLLAARVANVVAPAGDSSATLELRLIDGTLLRVTTFTSTSSEATVTHPQLGQLKLPMAVVQSVRFAPPDAKVDAAWNQLLERNSKQDQLAIRKNDVLDHLDGVIGSFNEATLSFRLDGDDIPVKREKIFGLIYSRRDPAATKPTAAVSLSSGDRLAARKVSWDGESWKVKLASGADFAISGSVVQSVDFSLGKIAYLSNMEPRDVKYTPFFDFVWEYRRDRSLDGRPLTLGNKTYAKGLALHSLTMIRYRIGGDYRRFQTVIGIDDDIRVAGNVGVIIKGDGRTLFKGSARVNQPPQPLDLDVTDVVELEIVVDYGNDQLDIGDRLHLADAKVLK